MAGRDGGSDEATVTRRDSGFHFRVRVFPMIIFPGVSFFFLIWSLPFGGLGLRTSQDCLKKVPNDRNPSQGALVDKSEFRHLPSLESIGTWWPRAQQDPGSPYCHWESVCLHFWAVSLFVKTSFSVGPQTEIVPGSSPDQDTASLAKWLQPESQDQL